MKNVLRNITPAVAVMIAGLAGAYLVYDNFFTANGESVAIIAPAAGDLNEESIIIAESTIPAATETTITTTTTDVVTTTAETVPAPVPAPAPNCDMLQAAATAAMGTPDAEKTQKAVAECLAAKAAVKAEGAADAAAVATDAATAADSAAQTAVDAASSTDAAATEAQDAAAAATEAVKETAPAPAAGAQ